MFHCIGAPPFSHPPTGEHLHCFHVWATVNKTWCAGFLCGHVFNSFGYEQQGAQRLDHGWACVLLSKKTAKPFSSGGTIWHPQQQPWRVSGAPHPRQHLVCSLYLTAERVVSHRNVFDIFSNDYLLSVQGYYRKLMENGIKNHPKSQCQTQCHCNYLLASMSFIVFNFTFRFMTLFELSLWKM